jgi:sigma-B regulation protein RsbU (phosphoserine phosphatase)
VSHSEQPKIQSPLGIKWRISIGAKFLILILLALSLTVSAIVFNAITLFKKDNTNNIYLSSDFLTSSKSEETRAWMESLIAQSNIIGTQLLQVSPIPIRVDESKSLKDLLYISIHEMKGPQIILKNYWTNLVSFENHHLQKDHFFQALAKQPFPLEKLSRGSMVVKSIQLSTADESILVLRIPARPTTPAGGIHHFITIAIHPTYIQDKYSDTGPYSLAMVNDEGQILISQDKESVFTSEQGPQIPIIQRMLVSPLEREFQEFRSHHKVYLGAYAKLGLAGLGVISLVSKEVAFESANILVKRSILIALFVCSTAFIIAYLFIQTIISPILALQRATVEISKGNFNIKIPLTTRDEMRDLAYSFNLMGAEIQNLLRQTADKARMEKELETARHVQNTMFPPPQIKIGNFHVEGYYTPAAECGGDWWGCIELPNNKVLLAIGDATGHGVPAAMITATAMATCTIIHSLSEKSPTLASSPKAMLHLLNKAVYESARGSIVMTFFIAVVDLKAQTITYASASHDPIYWYKKPSGAAPGSTGERSLLHTLEVEPGPILGQQLDSFYQQNTVQLNPGDFILLYTDGLPEGLDPNQVEYGERKFQRSVLRHSHEELPSIIRDNILHDFQEFIQGEPLHDDVTLAVCQLMPGQTEKS